MNHINELQRLFLQNFDWKRARMACLAQILQGLIYARDDAIALYRKWWEIETLFGCLKRRGFRMEDTQMTTRAKIEKLIFVLAIAFCWSYKLGAVKHEGAPIAKKTNGHPARSLFRLGLDCLRAEMLFKKEKIDDFYALTKVITCYKLTY